MARAMLIKNGIALIHDSNNHVIPTKTDILIQDGTIAKLAGGIQATDEVEVIDATDKIISPGFVDTHHHGWQTQLKGRHANELLLQYMVTGNYQHAQYSPKDVFYGQVGAMLEALAAGTTTVVDHAHITNSPDHAKQGIAATASSGIRSVFCYTPMAIVKSFNPLTFHPNPLEEWVMRTFSELADQGPFGDGRVTLGFAWDQWFLGPDAVNSVFEKVTGKGVKTITVHGTSLFNVTQILKGYGLLDRRALISHGGNLTQEDADLIKEAGAHVSATPSTELQMSMGRPLCFDAAFPGDVAAGKRVGVQSNASLGVDCHSNNAGSIISEARIGLQNARNHFGEHYTHQGKLPKNLPDSLSVEAAFNLATIKGAEAVNLEQEIGKIAEGYKADLVLLDAMSPGMIGAAQHDPVAAIILHSSPADIDTVIVDGIVRKRDGKLLPISVDAGASGIVGKETLEWSEIAKEIVKSREVIQKETEKVDVAEAMGTMMGMWQVPAGLIVDVN
ncbi:Metallo-dependent hydrolase [Lentithecium fluviatile CBS 122367]|uniref:Metallo-dependent hydrolase n=1 Tax=Lentithecium fluviatile CBS 122367 TaxID=1168545 RepID=A0A6G1IGG2_9PLEO|nr:Metallo-dependent hydrolase [Lentithecium fluviatile CBS 122367]